MNDCFSKTVSTIPELFKQLHESPPFMEKGIAAQKNRPGVYAFFENDVAVHVGRTRNLAARLRGHISKSHFSASFAFKRTRRLLGKSATYITEGSRAKLATDALFQPEFHRQIELVRSMKVRFVEIADPITQYLLELYAQLEYGLPLDEFDTH